MKLTKEKRVYGAVLGIAVAALAADRLFGAGDQGGPSSADASAYAAPASAPGAASTAAATPAPTGAVVSVAEQLASLDQRAVLDTGYTKNAFETWKTEPDRAAAPPTPAATALVDQFRQGHHLTGVLIASPRAFAVVDGKMIAVGQSIGGVKLVSVTQRTVTWQLQDGPQFVMPIEDHARASR